MNANHIAGKRIHPSGFSMVELLTCTAIILIITAVALPSLTRAYRNYQLNASAAQVAGILKFTRLEAIRRNTRVTCQIQQSGTNWVIWTDSNANGVADPGETQYLAVGSTTLVQPSSVPSSTALTTALTSSLGINSVTLLSGTNNAQVQFDQRGAVSFAGQPTIYGLFVGNPADPNSGYRAVILLPSGITRTWATTAGSSNGDWHQINSY